ncbi:MAG: D-alanyl-D-alanine carboxypeptidase, partial [Clostridia bacterium]|nr:D-alanyl-D-alanine carboxypeptidase [Clostridia bacterium]
LMDSATGTVLYSKNESDEASPASVTKIMTLLLVMEALRDGVVSLEDNVFVSSNAASMGGSQVFLEEGERISLEDLIKCTVIASGNDSAVALAEHIAGSENAFVQKMNERASSLGLKNTRFENVTGLDDTTTDHVSSAYDIAIMSKELISHELITKYSSMWQDSIRDGEFVLTNTNRLVRYYDGCNGLKTGSTDKAGFCVSVSAKRGELELIAVVMGAPTRDIRNNIARELLDYGFSSYAVYAEEEKMLEYVDVLGSHVTEAPVYSDGFVALVNKADLKKINRVYTIPENICAPLESGARIGQVEYKVGDKTIGVSDIFIKNELSRIDYFDIFIKMLKNCLFIE